MALETCRRKERSTLSLGEEASATHIVGTVGEGSSAGGKNLDERVHVLDLVGVLLGGSVHLLHASVVGGSLLAHLLGVDVDRGTVSEDGLDPGEGLVAEDDVEVLGLGPGALDGVLVDLLELLEVRRVVGGSSGGRVSLLGSRLAIVGDDGDCERVREVSTELRRSRIEPAHP